MTQKYEWRAPAVCLALVLGVIGLYAPALTCGFVNYDDSFYVVNNPHVKNGLAGAFGWAFQAGYARAWQPVTWLSHALDCQMFGMRPFGHHATSVLLHALNSALVFLALRRLTGAFWRSAVVAAFFACHPLHVETVAWVSERKGLLCCFFWLLALLAYLRFTKDLKSQALNSQLYYVGALVLFALALMSNPLAVTFPLILLVLDWWPLGRLAATPERSSGKQSLYLLVEKAPFFLLSLAACALTFIAQAPAGAVRISFKVRFVTACLSCFRDLAKSFWPSDLGAHYPFVFYGSRVERIGIALALAGIFIVAIRVARRRPYWLAGWLWFLLALLPAMNLVQMGMQPMSDRYMYIPSIGLWMLVCWEACDLGGLFRHGRAVLICVCVFLLAACCAASFIQIHSWKDDGALLARIPCSKVNAIGHADYASYLMHHGQLARAQAECEKAITISPHFLALPALLGKILLEEGKVDEAIQKFQFLLHADPSVDIARVELGRAYMAKNRPAEAVEEFKTVLRNNPRNFEAHHGLGRACLMQGKTADAVSEYRTSLTLEVNQPDVLNDLAWLLATDPRADIRHGFEAVQCAERACALTQNREPVFLGTLAAAFAEAGNFDKAVAAGQKAHDVAAAQGKKELADTNLQLLALYRAHKAFHRKQ